MDEHKFSLQRLGLEDTSKTSTNSTHPNHLPEISHSRRPCRQSPSSASAERSLYRQNPSRRKLSHTYKNTCRRRYCNRVNCNITLSSFSSYKIALLLIFISSLDITSARRRQPCLLDKSWKGEWFISGTNKPVIVDETSISHKGECVKNLNDRYLIKNHDYNCYRCLVIHQKHQNVLQYKETYCEKMNTLTSACSNLAGDAQLHSLFRIGAEPVPCPFPHTYIFSYNRGYGECSYPKSTVFSCIEDWRLLFRYQACPDVQGTESKSEELVCLAAWKDGSNRYLVGKSDHPMATSDEDRYRCFVYDIWEEGGESGFRVAQSGDATCNGLFSVNDGSRTLTLKKVNFSGTQCRFPKWAGGTHWHSLDGGTALHLTRHNSTLKLTGHSVVGGPATHACFKEEHSNRTSATFVTRVTHGCNSGYQCIQLISRDSNVLEFKIGKLSPLSDPDAACSHHYFDSSSKNFATFVSGKAEKTICPDIGRYEALGGSRNLMGPSSHKLEGVGMTLGTCQEEAFTALSVGCSSKETLEIHTTCSNSEYSCHGWWEESGWRYLVVTPVSRSSKGVRRLCLIIDRGEEILSLATSSTSCNRDVLPGHPGRISLNSTSKGHCESISIGSGSWSFSHQKTIMQLHWWLCLWLISIPLMR